MLEAAYFTFQVEADPHTEQVFLYLRAEDEGDEAVMSLQFRALNAADLAAKLMNAARDALGR